MFVSVRPGRGDLQPQLDSAMQDVSDKYLLLEETEKQAVRRALVEERSRFCCFVSMLRPVVVSQTFTPFMIPNWSVGLKFRLQMLNSRSLYKQSLDCTILLTLSTMLYLCQDEEMSMLGEITHLQTLTDDLKILTMDPHKLPASSEQV